MEFTGELSQYRFATEVVEESPGRIGRFLGRIGLRSPSETLSSDPTDVLMDMILDRDATFGDPVLRQDVRIALKSGSRDHLLGAADALSGTLLDNGFSQADATSQTLALLHVASVTDNEHSRMHGASSSTAASNAIFSLTAWQLAEFMAKPEDAPDAAIEQIKDKLQDILDGGAHNRNAEWLMAKTEVITSMVKKIQSDRLFVGSRAIERGRTYSPDQIRTHEEKVTSSFREILRSRSYGLKSAFCEESGTGMALVFQDGPESSRKLGGRNVAPIMTGSEAAAWIQFRSLDGYNRQVDRQIEVEPVMEQGHFEGTRFELTTLKVDASAGEAGIFLGFDGRLYSDISCQVPLSIFYEEIGAYKEYAYLQAEIISRFIELSAPAAAVNAKDMPLIQPSAKDSELGDTFNRLVLPRLKLLDKKEETDGSRDIRLHNVIWHRRKLPEGYKPSVEAIALAREMRVELEPGETLVRAHKRGNPQKGKVKGHHF